MTTIEAAERFLYAALSADATLVSLVGTNIYPDTIPAKGSHPAVVYTMLASTPRLTQDERKDMDVLRYLAKAIAEGPKETAAAIADAALSAIAAASPALVGGAYTVNATDVESWSLPSVEPLGKSGAKQFHQQGAIVRLKVRPA